MLILENFRSCAPNPNSAYGLPQLWKCCTRSANFMSIFKVCIYSKGFGDRWEFKLSAHSFTASTQYLKVVCAVLGKESLALTASTVPVDGSINIRPKR